MNLNRLFLFHFLVLLFASQIMRAGILDDIPSPVNNSKIDDDEVRLAEKYELGIGTNIDLKKAYELYSKAADLGNAEAQFRCACMANVFDDREKAITLFVLSAKQGYAPAEYELGLKYEDGEGVETNREVAIKLYGRAAGQEDDDAMEQLGECYLKGRGVKRDYAAALKWFKRAVEKGNRDAMFEVALMCRNGTASTRQWDDSIYWYYRAALRGHRKSADLIEELMRMQAGTIQTYELQKARFKMLSEQNDHSLLIETGDTKEKVISILGKVSGSWMNGIEGWGYTAGQVCFSNDRVAESTIAMTKEEYAKMLSDFDRDQASFTFHKGDTYAVVYSRFHDKTPFRTERCEGNMEIEQTSGGRILLSNNVVIQCEPAPIKNGVKQTAHKERENPILAWASYKPLDTIYPFLRPDNPKYWALATSAILVKVNGKRDDMLGTDLREQTNIRRELLSLYRWWGVANRADLLDKLDWIEKEGHRSDFEETGQRLSAMTEAQLNELPPDSRVVLQNYKKLGKKSLLGWDYSRYIALCRWGYLGGYLSEEEAWTRIMPAAKLLQKTFDSWADLGENYLIGREYWSPESNYSNRFQTAYNDLLTNQVSPWVLCPWNMNLDSDPNEEIPKKITYQMPPQRPPQQRPPPPPFNLERWLRINQQRLTGILVGGGMGILALVLLVKYLRKPK